jgi:TPR repeat protein
MKKIRLILLSTLAVASINAAVAKEVNSKKTDIIFSEEIWEKNQENKLAQFYLGEQHFMKKEYDQALSWYLQASFQNLESAIKNVQFMVQNKMGLDSNMEEVIKFMTLFADRGDEYSQMFLGNSYRNGDYQKDMKKSYYWYSRAADLGNDKATYYVGNMSIKGIGTIKNVPKGLRTLEKLAEQGHFPSIYNIGKTYKTGYKIAKNHEVAVRWFAMAAKEGHINSIYELADSYDRGFGVKRDSEEAYKWFESAALQGHLESTYRAGLIRLFGDNSDIDQSLEWLNIASVEGSEKAQSRLGDIFYEGNFGIKEDYVKAKHFYYLSAEKGNASSYRKIAMMYRRGGFGLERDPEMYEKYIKLYHTHKQKPMSSIEDRSKIYEYDIFNYQQDI